MIRKDREITAINDIIGIMKRCHVCRLAFNDTTTGYPYIVPMNFGLTQDGNGNIVLCFHCAKRGYKLDMIAKDPRVSFEMECDVELVYNPRHRHNTDIFKSVVGHGHAEIVDDDDMKLFFLQELVNRYHNSHIEVTSTDAARCAIFKITVEKLWGKEKRIK